MSEFEYLHNKHHLDIDKAEAANDMASENFYDDLNGVMTLAELNKDSECASLIKDCVGERVIDALEFMTMPICLNVNNVNYRQKLTDAQKDCVVRYALEFRSSVISEIKNNHNIRDLT